MASILRLLSITLTNQPDPTSTNPTQIHPQPNFIHFNLPQLSLLKHSSPSPTPLKNSPATLNIFLPTPSHPIHTPLQKSRNISRTLFIRGAMQDCFCNQCINPLRSEMMSALSNYMVIFPRPLNDFFALCAKWRKFRVSKHTLNFYPPKNLLKSKIFWGIKI